MLEKIDLNKKVDKKNYKEAMDKAGERLGLLQRECKAEGIPVMIVFEGMGAAGKGVQINRLIQAMDPRGFDVYACNRSNEEEQMRPFLWRYWTKTPAKGRFAIFDRSWYRSVQVDRFDGLTPEDKVGGAYQDILSFEKQLSDDGTVNTFKELVDYVAAHAPEAADMASDITSLQGIISSMPDEILSEIVNVQRTETTNTAEIRIFTKQEDGTYSPDVQHGVLTLIGAGYGPDGVNGAGLLSYADKQKLDGIDTELIASMAESLVWGEM